MEELLVTKNVAYAAKTGSGTISGIAEINSLAVGAIAIFSVEDNTLITDSTDADVLNSFKEFRFALGKEDPKTGEQYVYWSQPFGLIDRTTSPILTAYSAPTKQTSFLGKNTTTGSLNLPTLKADDVATLGIMVRKMDSPHEKETFYVEHLVTSSDTAATIVASLVTKVNAHPEMSEIVTASAQDTDKGIKFEGKINGQTFTIIYDGILINANTSTTAYAKLGNGTGRGIAELEDKLSFNRGNVNRVVLPQFHYADKSNIDLTATYDTFVIRTSALHSVSFTSKFTQDKTIIIANHTSATSTKTTLTELLQLIFNNIVIVEVEAE